MAYKYTEGVQVDRKSVPNNRIVLLFWSHSPVPHTLRNEKVFISIYIYIDEIYLKQNHDCYLCYLLLSLTLCKYST